MGRRGKTSRKTLLNLLKGLKNPNAIGVEAQMSIIERLNSPTRFFRGDHLNCKSSRMDEIHRLLVKLDATQYMDILKHLFPTQPQQMVAQPSPPPPREEKIFPEALHLSLYTIRKSNCPREPSIMRLQSWVLLLSTWSSTLFKMDMSHIDKPLEPMFFPPKGVLQNLTHNPNVRVSQHYNIAENLSQYKDVIQKIDPCWLL